MKKTLSGLALAIAAIAAPAAVTAQEAGSVYLPFGALYQDFDSYRQLQNDFMPTLGIGYHFTDRFAAEVMAARGKVDGDESMRGIDADVYQYRLDGLYFLNDADSSVRPFLVGGIGDSQVKWEHTSRDRDTIANAGVGLLVSLGGGWGLRGDVRAVRSLDYNQTELGANLLLQYSFGGKAAPAPVEPAPAPVAAAPVEPVVLDSDGDGVPDDKDRCPTTPPNTQVDLNGCDCNYTLKLNFEFDSAKLTAEDKAELDRLADGLKRLDFVEADVEGHTDSRGNDAYNQRLSERRAKAVITYLGEQGVDTSRLTPKGYGESQPVADNATDAGRAENRRAVIRRSDCTQ